jgi:hypothetical protein
MQEIIVKFYKNKHIITFPFFIFLSLKLYFIELLKFIFSFHVQFIYYDSTFTKTIIFFEIFLVKHLFIYSKSDENVCITRYIFLLI